LPRKKVPPDISSLCRQYTKESIHALADIMRRPDEASASRVAAANSLLDRGWGKAAQTTTLVSGENNAGFNIIIRHADE